MRVLNNNGLAYANVCAILLSGYASNPANGCSSSADHYSMDQSLAQAARQIIDSALYMSADYYDEQHDVKNGR